MRLFLSSFVCVCSLFLGSCATVVSPSKNSVPAAYLNQTYGDGAFFTCYLMSSEVYHDVQTLEKRSILEDSSLTEDQKEQQVSAIAGDSFAEKQWITLILNNNDEMPLLWKGKAIKISLVDAKGNPIMDHLTFFSLKYTRGIHVSYDYHWSIKAQKALTSSNYELPARLVLDFPNGTSMEYPLP